MMDCPPSPRSESTSSVLKDQDKGPSVEKQVKVSLDLVPSRKLDDPMTGWVSKVGREPAANGNTGSRSTPAEVPPSEAEKCNEPSKVLVKESICSSADCTLASKHARRKSLKPIIDV